MPRVQVYLDSTTIDALTKFAEAKGMPLSTAANDILKGYFEDTSTAVAAGEMGSETKLYLLRILNTLNQVLMCVYDQDKTSVKAETAVDCIQKITTQIQTFVEKDMQVV
ncbi:MAG: hypothetical protein A3F13_06770 [Gammaproteobacteria bacterium RIFCSPHIGHO2_12_FULL_40_19]|nr:MAG: hypothetical protein A3F13_06770 [Gammaproteobacteria bacterium RIFCSPHIGHO2_12_FULL_40_19]